ncbi:MAG: 3-methyl-2-oxobutanoate hydroxymethyltransferase, partial [Ottowia sp.]|nr:3-methyl-2-oxobutanoate hydroxymethyltransferase [Ottowia sp.]
MQQGAIATTTPERSTPMAEQKLTIPDITARKGGQPLSMLTAYDWAWARIQDKAGIDMLLVGDSLGMTMLG